MVDEALYAAHELFTNLLTKQPTVISKGAELHIIGRDPRLIFPSGVTIKASQLRNTGLARRAHTGLLTSCGEENLLRLEKDRYRGRDICLHEFAHNVLDNGCPREIKARFAAQRTNSLAKGLWEKSYAGSNVNEFFAELTMWYFGTHGDLRMAGPKPEKGREGLMKHDHEAYKLMDDFYSGRIDIGRVEPRRRR